MSSFLPDNFDDQGATDTGYLKEPISEAGKLTAEERAQWIRFNASVNDLSPEFKAWITNFMLVEVAGQLPFTTSSGTMTGEMKLWPTSTAPSGYLLCDGTAVSRTDYVALFTIMGTSYGVGDGSTTFNVPDLRGRVPVGLGTHADVNALNGSEGVTLANRSPKHKSSGDLTAWANTSSGTFANNSSSPVRLGSWPGLTNNVSTPLVIGPQTGEPTNTPAYLVVNYIIKT